MSKEPTYVLRLFITGTTPRSARAIANLRRMCEQHLPTDYSLEVIDIYQQPLAAAEHQIVAAPTLVRLLPLPIRRIIGDLADEGGVLAALEVRPRNGANLTQ